MPKVLQKFTTDDGDFWMEIELSEEDYKQLQSESPENNSDKETGKIPIANDILSTNQMVNWTPEKFDKSVLSIVPLFKSIQKVLSEVSPSEYEIEAGIKFNKRINALFISGGADFDFKVKLKWQVEKKDPLTNQTSDES